MEKISSALHSFSKFLVIVMLGALSIIIIAQVLCRTFLGFSIVWSEEIARYLLIWITVLGASIGLRNGELAGLDLLESRLKLKAKETHKLILHLLSLFFVVYLIYFGIKLAFSPGVLGQQSPTLKFSMVYVYMALPTGGVIMLIHLLAAISSGIRRLKERTSW